MLSPDDAQVAQRDPELIGLPVLLDPPLLLERLRQRLPEIELKGIRGSYLRYKPKTNCLASYMLDTSVGEFEIYAKAYTPADATKLAKLEQRPSTSLLGPGQIHLDDLAIGVFVFPNDADLESLGDVASEDGRERLLRQLLPELEDVSRYSIERLAYKPERRYVGQLRLDDRPRAVLRFYSNDDFLRASRNTKVLESGKTLRLPGRVGRSERDAAIALEWLEGALLSELLARDSIDQVCFQSAGWALAELHAMRCNKLRGVTRQMEVEAINQSVEFAAAICPDLAEELANLAGKVGQYLLEQPVRAQCVHGDLHAQQILFQSEGVALLDLDEAYRGDAAADIGNFLAQLWRAAPEYLEKCRTALLDGYSTGGVVSADHVRRYTAASLLRLTPEPFRRREANWPMNTRQILQEAQRIFARPEVHSSPVTPPLSRRIPVHDPFRIANDPAMPFLPAAIDPESMSKLFSTYLPWPAQLVGLRVVRYKPQRRCLIEYDIETDSRPMTLVGKARAKRLDERTFHVQRQLWNSGFDNDSADGISVPKPIAMIPPLQMWLQQRVPGTASIDLLVSDSMPQTASRLAGGIFKLHQCAIHPKRSHTMLDELRMLQEKLPLVAQSHPHLRQRLQRLLEACLRAGESHHAPPLHPIHRDFYHDQVIVDGARIYLLDLDLFAMGDPALDLGNFIGHLSEYGLRKFGSADALAGQQRKMIDRYLEMAGEEPRPRIHIHSFLTLARHVYISTRFADRTPFVERILSLCEERMAEIT
jgi:aminoglycoside phosphotransferase (APT) family kinase protein